MIESLILIEGSTVKEEALRSVSLANAKQLVIGRVPSTGTVLHVAANSPADLSNALLAFARVKGVKGVLTLTLRTSG
jgi:hypothetical protein